MIHDTELYEPVRAVLAGADDDSIRIVAAIGGLLGAVAYADGTYDPSEMEQIRVELDRVEGLDSYGVAAIMQVLKDRLVSLSTVDIARNTRVLRELADHDLRREVVALLLRIAAADGTIVSQEVALLRQITHALGLSQSDYNRLQQQHRHLLDILQAAPK